jgi:fructose-bisphosphate aldolase, class II
LSCLHAHELLCLRAQSLEENVEICKKYLERMAKCNVLLEMELGVTGGEEDGVDNTDVDSSRLYTQPEEVWYTYEQLSKVRPSTLVLLPRNVHPYARAGPGPYLVCSS